MFCLIVLILSFDLVYAWRTNKLVAMNFVLKLKFACDGQALAHFWLIRHILALNYAKPRIGHL